MTEKELLYIEDAVNHECNIIKIVTDIINNLEDEQLKSFMKEKLNEHMAFKVELINALEDYADE